MPTPGSNPDTRMPDAEFIAAARSDVPRLVAALTAVLDLADEWRASHYPIRNQDEHDLRAAITEHLTLKENDS